MLVLTRKPGEEVQIGSHVTVSVLEVQGGCVKIGIEAPDQLRILRQELVGGDAGPEFKRPPARRTAAIRRVRWGEEIDVPRRGVCGTRQR